MNVNRFTVFKNKSYFTDKLQKSEDTYGNKIISYHLFICVFEKRGGGYKFEN